MKRVLILVYLATFSSSMFIPAIIDQFSEYIICFNYDNTTKNELKEFTRMFQSKMHPGVYLTNHDLDIPYDDYQLNGLQHLHVFLLRNISKVKNDLLNRIDSRDAVIIFVQIPLSNSELQSICKIDALHNGGGVFFIKHDSSVSSCCYYCNRHEISLRRIEKSVNLPWRVNNFTNFHGYRFRIGFAEFLPFFWCSYDKERRCKIYHGPEWEIIQALSKSLNFKYNIIEFGERANKSAWGIMTGKIYFGEIDWAVSGITQTLERSEALDFTRYIKVERYMAIYKSHHDHWSIAVFLVNSIHESSWAILLTTVVTVIVLSLVAKCSMKIFHKHGDMNIFEYALITAMFVYEQHSNKLLRQMAVLKSYVRLVFLLWIICCTCINTYYKSQLASLLMVTPTDPSDTEDMIGKGFKFEIHKYDIDYLRYSCMNSTNIACKKMLQAEVIMSICESVAKVFRKKIAYLGDELPLQYMALRKCNISLQQKYGLKIATARAIGTEWQGWPLRKYTPFVRSFSRIISRLEASGLLHYWYQRELGIFRGLKTHHEYLHEVVSRPLSVYHFLFPFIVLVIGNCVSSLVFIGEIFYAKSHPIQYLN